jgi:hypothetical protein
MHFVSVDRSCKISGVTAYLLLAAQKLVERGHQFTLAARPGALSSAFEEAGATYVRTAFWPFNVPPIERFLRHQPADIFLCCARGRARRAALALARRHGRPCLCLLHDPLWPHQTREELLQPTALATMERPIYDQVLALGVPPERVRILPRPVRQRPMSPPPADGFHIVHLGRLSEAKAPSAVALLEATPDLSAAIPGLVISIVGGGGKLEAVRSLATATNTRCGRQVVQVVGETLDPLLWLEQANLMIAGGYSCLEALYNGRPAIGSGFAWFGPIQREDAAAAIAAHFGDRAAEPASRERMRDAVLQVREALSEPARAAAYTPQRDWFPEDHSGEYTAAALEAIATELLAGQVVQH